MAVTQDIMVDGGEGGGSGRSTPEPNTTDEQARGPMHGMDMLNVAGARASEGGYQSPPGKIEQVKPQNYVPDPGEPDDFEIEDTPAPEHGKVGSIAELLLRAAEAASEKAEASAEKTAEEPSPEDLTGKEPVSKGLPDNPKFEAVEMPY